MTESIENEVVQKLAAASGVGGTITRAEVIARARHWLGAGLRYDQGGHAWDKGHTRKYRTDCSGMICMAWHLNADPDTDHLPQHAVAISGEQLRPGDILDYTVGSHDHHHVVLFQAWEGNGKFSYLSFGHTPMTEYHHATLSRGDGSGNLAGHPVSGYRAYRYRHISDSDVPQPPTGGGKLVVDGELGPKTYTRLQQSLNKTGADPKLDLDGDFGPKTERALQARLNHTNPPVAIDGSIGPETVRALQKNVGAPVDGEWGPATTRALQTTLNNREL